MGIRHLPYDVVLGKHHVGLPVKWCQDNIGPRWSAIGPERETGLWTVFWVGPEAPEKYRWHFKHEKDYVLAVLRWS